MIVAYINRLPYTAEDLQCREERLRELVQLLGHKPGKDWELFVEHQKNAKIVYMEQG